MYTPPLKSTEVIEIMNFLTQCREFEKKTFPEAYENIYQIFNTKPASFKSHLCDQWRWKKKDFGSFYLNLSNASQIAFYNYFGISLDDDKEYIILAEEKPFAQTFADTPTLQIIFHKLHLFFNNNGINKNCTEYLKLENVPAFDGNSFSEKNKGYGNSKNWCNYLMKQKPDEQKRIFELIILNYNG